MEAAPEKEVQNKTQILYSSAMGADKSIDDFLIATIAPLLVLVRVGKPADVIHRVCFVEYTTDTTKTKVPPPPNDIGRLS